MEAVSHSLKSSAETLSYRELAKRCCRTPAGPKLRVAPQRVALKTLRAGPHRLF